MEKNKTYSDYTQEELSKLDAGTIADLIWEERKYSNRMSIKESLLEYEKDHRLDYWN